MILTCPACSTRYLTDASSFAPHGRTVRCAKCNHAWFQEMPDDATVQASAQLSSGALQGLVNAPKPLRPEAVLPPRRTSSMVPVVIFIALGLIFLVAALYQYRAQVVASTPGAALFYETLGIETGALTLEFRNVQFRWADDEQTRLELWGEVVNVGSAAQDIPLIRVSMRDGEARELYGRTITLQQRHLSPGASNSFALALENPPDGAVDITVDFLHQGY